jgi:uncharacterized protein (TIGR00661 family)
MRILYGVQTTGNGHIVRSRAMIGALRERGHEVHPLLSGPELTGRWSIEDFAPCVHRRGLTFVTERGRLHYLRTARQLKLGRFVRDVFSFKPTDFDLVITDYEPLTARIAALRGIPSIGIGHLYAFSGDVPLSSRNPFTRTIMRRFAPARHPLGLHWHHFDQAILPPTIPPDVPEPEAAEEDLIVVYLPFEHLEDVEALLAPVSDRRFRIYTRQVERPVDRRHIGLRPISRGGFLEDLSRCTGVICNAGFSLVSEALHLGKKVLVKPLHGQIEQCSNAVALSQLGFGQVMERLDPEAVRRWLDAPAIVAQRYPGVLEAVIEWIDEGRWHEIDVLADTLWPEPLPAGSDAAPLEKTV